MLCVIPPTLSITIRDLCIEFLAAFPLMIVNCVKLILLDRLLFLSLIEGMKLLMAIDFRGSSAL